MIARSWLKMIFIVVAAAALSPASAAVAAEDRPTAPEAAARFIDALGSQVLGVLGSSNADLERREAKVRDLLAANIDLARIGRFALGRAWPEATPEQRDEYLRLFSEWVVRTYARRLGGYAGETFKIIRAEPMGKQDAAVLTEIGRPSGPPLTATWRVRHADDGYKILDVIVEGVSMIATQRAEFASLVGRQGVDGLIESLRMQVSRFAARAS